MSAAQKHDTHELPEASMNLLKALQQGAPLRWGPDQGYRVTLPSGKVRRVRWFVASALRQAGIIETDESSWSKARVWRLAPGWEYERRC